MRPVMRVVLWFAVVSLIALSVIQKRPRPNEALRQDDMAAERLPASPVDGVRRLPS
ncbi:MAG: hypothetical protein NTW00_07800 [Hyphomicrobiales bacterium]|nr:hypothetical protein [Hyphomicrobiales bacterium]